MHRPYDTSTPQTDHDPGPLPERVEPETGPTLTVPISGMTAISVEECGGGATRLTVAHNANVISVMLLAPQVDEIVEAIIASSAVPLELVERLDQVVTEVRPERAS